MLELILFFGGTEALKCQGIDNGGPLDCRTGASVSYRRFDLTPTEFSAFADTLEDREEGDDVKVYNTVLSTTGEVETWWSEN